MASNSNNQSWALRPWGTPEWLRQRPANPPISALIRCLRRWGFPFPKARGGADQYGALAGWSVVVQVVLWGWTGRRRRRTTRGRRRGRAALRGCGESQEQSRLGLSDRRQNLDCKTWQWRTEAARDLSKAGRSLRHRIPQRWQADSPLPFAFY
uniref:Uncharacterized protein LOC114914072 n=1 Tax=Elaeis guineensis var. tenera TaxID=51953 RepID=A0A8N4ID52_ELAGV|nr:uncharacterized protein LOC114914072 [Elaeis guineensis]